MMKQGSPRSLPMLSLSLALLLAGAGCSHASEGEQTKGKDSAPPKPGAAAAPAAGTAAPTGSAPATITPDKLPVVVAKLNGKDIKKDELLKEAQSLKGQIGGAALPAALPPAFYRQVLDGMIARNVLMADAAAQGIKVSDAEIQQQIGQLRSHFPTPDDFQKALAAQGMTEAGLTATAREQLTVQKYVDTVVMANVAPANDAAAKTFYDQNLEKMKQPEQRHLRHILIKVDKGASEADKAKAKAQAETVLAQLKKGGDFAALAKANSGDPGSKDNGGDLSFIRKGQTVPTFEAAAWALQTKDQLSPVVESPFGYHIIQLVEIQPAKTMTFEEVKPKIVEYLKQQQGQEHVKAKIEDLKSKAKIEYFI